MSIWNLPEVKSEMVVDMLTGTEVSLPGPECLTIAEKEIQELCGAIALYSDHEKLRIWMAYVIASRLGWPQAIQIKEYVFFLTGRKLAPESKGFESFDTEPIPDIGVIGTQAIRKVIPDLIPVSALYELAKHLKEGG